MSDLVTFRQVTDASDPAWHSLIALYTESFEDAQREAEAGILQNLRTRERPKLGGHIVIAALDSHTVCIGGIIFSYLPMIDCGYVSYLFVSSRFRKRGIGTALLKEARLWLAADAAAAGQNQVIGFFAEIQRDGRPDPILGERLNFWQKAGVLPLDLEWRYPPLRCNEPAVPTYLAYGSYGPARESWFPRDIESVAVAIFRATYDYLPEAARALREIVDALRRRPPGRPIPYLTPAALCGSESL